MKKNEPSGRNDSTSIFDTSTNATLAADEQLADLTRGVIMALKASRGQAAFRLATELEEKYLATGEVVEGGDQVTDTGRLATA